jgi:hypothetical protein
MRRIPAKVIAIILAAITVSGTGIAAASAQPSTSASPHGTEHFTLILTSTKTGVGSVIATGAFTDGGTMNLFSEGPSTVLKLGAGTIRVTPTSPGGPRSKTNLATCLTTVSERGTYKLNRGTGRYAGIHGSGRFTAIDHVVSHHKRNGGCVTTRPPLAVQAILTLSGPVTLRH